MKKTIVITGSSRGIGLELCRHFLRLGFSVVGISRSPTPIEDQNFHFIAADLSKPQEVEELAAALNPYTIVGLINNAGIHGPLGPFEGNDFEHWKKAFQVNFFAGARLTQIVIPHLRKNNGFTIFLSGGGAGFGRANFSAYGVSKTAVVRLAENLALELAPDVLVYCVAPGPNPTALLEESIRAGTPVPPEERVDFSYPLKLCEFLAQNKDPLYSGRFIHVKDSYAQWKEKGLKEDAYKLRRIKV